MSVPYTRPLSRYDVELHADGEVSFMCEGDDSELSFSVDELMKIIQEANAHKKAYAMYKESGYENEEGYKRTMLFLCGRE